VTDDDRGQSTTFASARLLSGLLIAVAVAGLVVDGMFDVAEQQLAGERITEVGGPAIQPEMAVGVVVVGVVVLGSVHLLSWFDDRRSANGDRDSPNDD
jgi:uncharacterized membrane protein YidH (DUF202 family)